MNNLKLFIEKDYIQMLQAFADDSYLYNYIVNNYSELSEDNIFRNPTILKKIDEMIYLSKDNISLDDKIVWDETSEELRKKKVSYFAVITDQKSGAFFIYNNLDKEIRYLDINKNTDSFDAIRKIESFDIELQNDEEMEM